MKKIDSQLLTTQSILIVYASITSPETALWKRHNLPLVSILDLRQSHLEIVLVENDISTAHERTTQVRPFTRAIANERATFSIAKVRDQSMDRHLDLACVTKLDLHMTLGMLLPSILAVHVIIPPRLRHIRRTTEDGIHDVKDRRRHEPVRITGIDDSGLTLCTLLGPERLSRLLPVDDDFESRDVDEVGLVVRQRVVEWIDHVDCELAAVDFGFVVGAAQDHLRVVGMWSIVAEVYADGVSVDGGCVL